MKLHQPIVPAILVRRYKRFLADVILPDGEETTVHCANPGAMAGLAKPGSRILCSTSPNKARKLPLSWELVEVDHRWVGINTSVPNRVVAEALSEAKISACANYSTTKAEVSYGQKSRVDFLLSGDGLPSCYLEVKNVHYSRQTGLAEFPDSKTDRGARHLDELAAMVRAGHRAINLYLVQRDDCSTLSFAEDHDPSYVAAVRRARAAGVEFLAYGCHLSDSEIKLGHQMEVIPPHPTTDQT